MARRCINIIALVLTAVVAVTIAADVAQGVNTKVRPSAARAAKPSADGRADFMRRVYEAQMTRALEEGRTRYTGLDADQLGVVAGRHKLRKDAAEQCRLLLAQAMFDLKREKTLGRPEALKVSSFGIYSAYRSVEHDATAWRSAFNRHLGETKVARAKLSGGEYGDKALNMMVAIMRSYKAAPGFSRHTGGTAVDFVTVEDGFRLTADSGQNTRWKKTWFHQWLVRNASKFKFNPLATEAWHWDYKK